MDNTNERLQEVYKISGENLSKALDSYFSKDKDQLVNWFYDSNNAGLGKSPHDFCKEGNQDKLEDILVCLAQGNSGG